MYEKAWAAAMRDPGYKAAYRVACDEFAELLATRGATVERFWETIGTAAAYAVSAAPALAEAAAALPDGRPSLVAKRLIASLADDHPQDPLARKIRDELTRIEPSVAIPPRPLDEIRESLDEWPEVGRPAGPSEPSDDLRKVRRDAEKLEARILDELRGLLEQKRDPTVRNVAGQLGIGRRTLIDDMEHHGLIWRELKKAAKADQDRKA
ncbi:MAG: hypothetical protein M3O91_06230 [Chloroflexota bacterium]|nr:hypothetical protein [Chloroflexota bacterium]